MYWFSSEIYLVISLSIGMLISIITKTQIVAVVLTVIVTIIPGFLYSGILMPISSMVGMSRYEAHAFPIMYYNHILYDVFLVGEAVGFDKNRNVSFYLDRICFVPYEPWKRFVEKRTTMKVFWTVVLRELVRFIRSWQLVVVVLYAFSMEVYIAGSGIELKPRNVAVGYVDASGGGLSQKLLHYLHEPEFLPPVVFTSQEKLSQAI